MTPTHQGAAPLPEALEKIFETLEDRIYEWSNYVRADDAPTTLPKYVEGAIKDLRAAVVTLHALTAQPASPPQAGEAAVSAAAPAGAEVAPMQGLADYLRAEAEVGISMDQRKTLREWADEVDAAVGVGQDLTLAYMTGFAAGKDAPTAPQEGAPAVTDADIEAAREFLADAHNATQMRSALGQLRREVVIELAARGLVPDYYGAAVQPQAGAESYPPTDELKGTILGAAYDFRDAHISGSMNLKRSAHAALESAIELALRARGAVPSDIAREVRTECHRTKSTTDGRKHAELHALCDWIMAKMSLAMSAAPAAPMSAPEGENHG